MSTLPAALLGALSAELSSTRGGVDALASLVSEYVHNCPMESRSTALQEAQAVDALAQTLDALSGFARRLSSGESVEAALAAIPLTDLAGRLRTAVQRSQDVRPDHCLAGELMLFE